MLSPSFKKPVFIDFGLSELIEEEVGIYSNIYFKGSMAYCSDEMSKAYKTKQKELVDFYYNDLHCLSISEKEIKKMVPKNAVQVEDDYNIYFALEEMEVN